MPKLAMLGTLYCVGPKGGWTATSRGGDSLAVGISEDAGEARPQGRLQDATDIRGLWRELALVALYNTKTGAAWSQRLCWSAG